MSIDSKTPSLGQLIPVWIEGDASALETLINRYYETHFLPMALRKLTNETVIKTTTPPAALVSRTFEKMRGRPPKAFLGEKQFWAWVSTLMKQVIFDLVRYEKAAFRGGKAKAKNHVPLRTVTDILEGRKERGL